MSDFLRRWLFYLSLSGFLRNAHNKDVYNALMWATATIFSLVALKY